RVLHGTAVCNTPRNLLRDALRDQARVGLRDLDLLDLEVDLLANFLLDELAQALDIGALLADHDSRLRREERHINLVRRTLKLDPGNTRPRELLHNQLTDRAIFVQQLSILLFREPFRFPVAGDAQAETDGMYFTTH